MVAALVFETGSNEEKIREPIQIDDEQRRDVNLLTESNDLALGPTAHGASVV